MIKSVLIIGLGRFGRHMAMKFVEQGNDVMAVEIGRASCRERVYVLV